MSDQPGTHNVYVCSVCQNVQTSVFNMQEHMKTHKTFQCEACSQTFKKKQILRSHFKAHHDKSEFSCPICNKKFLHIRYLEQHVKIHSTIKQFVCDVCSKQFTQLVHLKSHAATHLTRKPFPCKICKKEFSCKGSLLRHSQVHTENNSFVCSLCNKSFSRKDSLVLHVQVIHEMKRSHKCAKCKLVFTQKAYLKSHQEKVHTKNEGFFKFHHEEMHMENKICPTKAGAKTCMLKKEIQPEIKLSFSVSILKKVSNTNKAANLGKSGPKPTSTEKAEEVPTDILTSSVNQDTKQQCSKKADVTTKVQQFSAISVGGNSSSIPESDMKEIPSALFPCVSTSKESLHKQEKNCNNYFALFGDSDVCEILDPTPPNLEADFLLDSLGDWENECQLSSEVLSSCSVDQDLVLESSQEVCNKRFLNVVHNDYFNSLQCIMPFNDLQT